MAGTPSIYQNRIVWDSIDREELFEYAALSSLPPPPNYDVFLLDLDTGEVTQLTTEEHSQRSPRIYGDTIIWLDARSSGEQFPYSYDIYAYDLKTGQEKRITEDTTVEGYNQAAIDGGIIVWTDMRHADMEVASHAGNDSAYNNEIYAYDLNTGDERRLTTSPKNDHAPDISGNIVTWLRQEDYRKADIFACDLESGVETQVSTSGYAVFSPSVYEDKIAWTDARSSKGNTNNDVVENGQIPGADIYLYDLETKKETRLTETEEGKVWDSPVISGNYLVYQWSRQIGALAYVMNLSSFAGSTMIATENHNLIPVKELDLFQVEQKCPDDIIAAPGLGPAYRANVHQQGVENPWPSVEVSEAYLGSGANEARIYYRSHIETAAGETRNNIIKAIIPGVEVGSLRLYADNISQDIMLTDGMQWSGPFARVSVLIIEVAPDVISGEYPLEIGLLINGEDYGAITCTIDVRGEKS
jgi:beta propeller repeat protein